LPMNTLLKIVGLCRTSEDLCNLSMTCRLFYKMANHDMYWEPLSNPSWVNHYPSHLSWKEKYLLWLKEYIYSYRHLHSKFRIQKQSKSYHFYLKILMIGTQGSGKTSLKQYFLEKKFYQTVQPTFGNELHTKLLNYNNRSLQVHIWEITNSNFISMSTLAAGILAIFDITSKLSFDSVCSQIQELRTKIPSIPPIPILLVATKSDLKERAVSIEQINQVCHDFTLGYIETSAKNGDQVDIVFLAIVKKISEYTNKTPSPLYVPDSSVMEKYGVSFGDIALQEQLAGQSSDEEGTCVTQ